MSQINSSDAAAATPAKGKPYRLTGRVVGEVKRSVTQGASPKPYGVFTFEYGVKGRDGMPTTQTRTGKAFGQGLANIEPALAAGGDVTMVGRFETTPLGQTIVFYALPSTPRAQAAG